MAAQNLTPTHDETDALFDTSPRAMAARFAMRAKSLMTDGRDPKQAVRLAASYAFMVDPALRPEGEPAIPCVSDVIYRLGQELQLEALDAARAVKH